MVQVSLRLKNRVFLIQRSLMQKKITYGGPVVIKVGIDNNMQVKGVRILEHNETPGLGAKIKDKSFLNQFTGKTGSQLYLKKYSKEGTIDAVTGATISSKAVSDGIREIYEKLILPSDKVKEGN